SAARIYPATSLRQADVKAHCRRSVRIALAEDGPPVRKIHWVDPCCHREWITRDVEIPANDYARIIIVVTIVGCVEPHGLAPYACGPCRIIGKNAVVAVPR